MSAWAEASGGSGLRIRFMDSNGHEAVFSGKGWRRGLESFRAKPEAFHQLVTTFAASWPSHLATPPGKEREPQGRVSSEMSSLSASTSAKSQVER